MHLGLRAEEICRLRDIHYNATVLSLRRIHNDLMLLRVVPNQGSIQFQPGQYTLLGLGSWESRVDQTPNSTSKANIVRRAYSISCPMINDCQELVSATELPFLEFYIALVTRNWDDPPLLTPRLFALKPGDRLFLGPHCHGKYLLDPVRTDDTVLFFGTGTGEAPHNAYIAELLKRGHRGLIVCATSVRYFRDLAYLQTHKLLERRFSNYHYFSLTTREPENLDPSRKDYIGKRYLQDLVHRKDFRDLIEGHFDPLRTHAYVCGNPAMIGLPQRNSAGNFVCPQPKGMVETLMEMGLRLDAPHHPGTIHFEKYW